MGDVVSLHQRQKPGLATLVRVSGVDEESVLSAIESDPGRGGSHQRRRDQRPLRRLYYSDAELLRAVWRDAY